MHDDFITADFEDCSVRRFVAQAVMKFSNDKVKGTAFSCDNTALWCISQRRQRLMESLQPLESLLRGPVFSLPQRLIQHLLLGTWQDCDAVLHSLLLSC